MVRKTHEYRCPCCGSLDNVSSEGTEFEGEFLTNKLWCNDCAVSWREFFIIDYDGYAYQGKEYNRQGDEVD